MFSKWLDQTLGHMPNLSIFSLGLQLKTVSYLPHVPLPAKNSRTGCQSMSKLLADNWQGGWSQDLHAKFQQLNTQMTFIQIGIAPKWILEPQWPHHSWTREVRLSSQRFYYFYLKVWIIKYNSHQPGVVFRFLIHFYFFGSQAENGANEKLFWAWRDLRSQYLSSWSKFKTLEILLKLPGNPFLHM